MEIFSVIRRPVITEKAYRLLNELPDRKKYVLRVSQEASKDDVLRAVELVFKAKVEKVNLINIPGKRKKYKGILGRRQDTRKAIVTLEPGYEINEFVESAS